MNTFFYTSIFFIVTFAIFFASFFDSFRIFNGCHHNHISLTNLFLYYFFYWTRACFEITFFSFRASCTSIHSGSARRAYNVRRPVYEIYNTGLKNDIAANFAKFHRILENMFRTRIYFWNDF